MFKDSETYLKVRKLSLPWEKIKKALRCQCFLSWQAIHCKTFYSKATLGKFPRRNEVFHGWIACKLLCNTSQNQHWKSDKRMRYLQAVQNSLSWSRSRFIVRKQSKKADLFEVLGVYFAGPLYLKNNEKVEVEGSILTRSIQQLYLLELRSSGAKVVTEVIKTRSGRLVKPTVSL